MLVANAPTTKCHVSNDGENSATEFRASNLARSVRQIRICSGQYVLGGSLKPSHYHRLTPIFDRHPAFIVNKFESSPSLLAIVEHSEVLDFLSIDTSHETSRGELGVKAKASHRRML